MSLKPSTFKVTDFRRAVRAAKLEGLPVAGVRVSKTGEIEVIVGKPAEPEMNGNSLDKWIEGRAG